MNAVPGDQEMPLVEHIKELRSRMIITAVPIIILTLIAFLFSDRLLQYIWEQTVPVPMTIYSPMDPILIRFSLSLMCALFFGIPIIIYEAFMFVSKGLYPNEKKFVITVVPLSFILFIAGAAFAFFVVVPFVFKATILSSINIATPQISAIKTIYTLITLILSFGIIFQFPLLVVFSIKMGLIKLEYLKGKRKVVYGILLAFSLLVSPDPSALSQLIIAATLAVLFEISLLLARVF
ncbi:MAG: twin-arginine translocase subunit TatC [Candidatus Methanoperedens sp.]|nr:twin-arginine translocase subunit TatC [Candidatus Methanoperedens sp.]